MRLTTIILIASLIQVSAATFAQRITLNQRNTPLESVFKEIRKQSGYDFFYDGKAIKPNQRVNISVTDVSVEDALKSVLKDLPFTYEISDNRITIRKKEEPTFLDNIKVAFAAIDVHGRVVDEKGQPLPGVTVKLKDESQVTATDKDGNFILRKVNENAVIVITSIGYLSKEINAKSDLGTIALDVSNSKLDEVQVMAYGKTSRRLSTSSITSVKAIDIEKQPVTNPLLAMVARVPGLEITPANGVPGGGVKVRIQGQNSIANGSDPYYVVDGIPYVSQMLSTTEGATILGGSEGGPGSGSGNPLNYINPADIESIEVLKDADATAIYGSRAANGVILITTKKGQKGKTIVSATIQNGVSKAKSNVALLNTQQYLQMRHQALKNDNIIKPGSGDYDINGLWDTTRYTNWQKELIGKTAHYTNVNASLSGGTNNYQYLVSGTYNKQTSIYPGDFADTRASLHFSTSSQSFDNKLQFRLTGSFLSDNNHLPSADLASLVIRLAPDAPALYNPDGSLNWAPTASGSASWRNPLSYTLVDYRNKTNNLMGNSLISYHLLKGLDISSNFGYTRLETKEYTPSPLIAVAPANRPTGEATARYSNSEIDTWIVEPQLNFRINIGRGLFTALLGTTFQQQDSEGSVLVGHGYLNDSLLPNIDAAATVTAENSVDRTYKYNAVFSRINYNIDDKYILNISGRRDGSSRFGDLNKFSNFGAVGLAWVFNKEKFFERFSNILSFGKLRANFGITGNDQIGDYQYLDLYQPINFGLPYQNLGGLTAQNLSNAYIQWEKTRKFQVGLDLAFWQDRFLITANYINNISSNQLLDYILPNTTGFPSILTNFPATIRNTAWEFSMNTVNIDRTDFNWKTNFNITIPKNEVVSFPNIETSTYRDFVEVGQPFGLVKAYHYLNVDPATGVYQFMGKDGKVTNAPVAGIDDYVRINTSPQFYGGLENSLRFKNIDLSFLLQYVKKVSPSNYFGPGSNQPGSRNQNEPVRILDRWQKNGDESTFQKFSSNSSLVANWRYAQGSDANYLDGSYLRLKNISISYSLSKVMLERLKIQNCRVFLSCQNLLTFTKYLGFDPETLSYSQLKTTTFGIQLGL